MYGYKIYLYSRNDPIRTVNETNKIKLLPPWDFKYLEFIGFVKNQIAIPIHQLEIMDNFNSLKGSSPIFILNNGNPKILKYKVKQVEKVIL